LRGWLAYQATRHDSPLTLPGGAPAGAGRAAIWGSGLAINLLNPKSLLFLMTFVP
jgi:threonine/homoserine/homoserine lactone efflux protein